jgi:TetR/AcrR family tetracycline transcriptional repressor
MSPRATRGRTTPLDEERIVTAAFAILDAEGFEGLTVRRIAERLRVQNPALYWHFDGKKSIVDRMAERMLAEMVAGARAVHPTGWRPVLEAAARSFRRVMRRHRDGARVVAAADLAQSPMTASMTETLGLLVAAGFSERDALVGVVAVFDYTMGATFEEQEDPRPARAMPPSVGPRSEKDAMFEGGLELLLDGLGARLAPLRRARRARPTRARATKTAH